MAREIKFRWFVPDLEDGHWDFGKVKAGDELWIPDGGKWIGQFIGLKDKNGEEIFEGDILHVPYSNERKKLFFVVEWSKDRWWPQDFNHFDWDEKDEAPWEESEVLGNVYENNELLK